MQNWFKSWQADKHLFWHADRKKKKGEKKILYFYLRSSKSYENGIISYYGFMEIHSEVNTKMILSMWSSHFLFIFQIKRAQPFWSIFVHIWWSRRRVSNLERSAVDEGGRVRAFARQNNSLYCHEPIEFPASSLSFKIGGKLRAPGNG